MKTWLMKSERSVYSIEDLKRDKVTTWNGVRNYQARNNLMAMKTGDRVLFYYSAEQPTGIAGEAKVVKEAYPDPTAFDPKDDYYDPKSKPEKPSWFLVEVAFVRQAKDLLTTQRLKQVPGLKDMVLFHNSRLSVQPVTEAQWKIISRLEEW